MSTSVPDAPSPGSITIRGGGGAPRRARSYVLDELDGQTPAATASDAALVASELVTNSVLHANMGRDHTLSLELLALDDRVRLAVTDAGSPLEPRLLPFDPATPGGFGLRLVEEMSCAWGIQRNDLGATSVWCELPFDHAAPA